MYLAGEATSKGITFLALVVIAGLVAPADYAQINLYLTFANIAAVLLTLALPNAVVRFSIGEHSIAPVVSTALIIQIVMLSLGVIVVSAVGDALAVWLRVPTYLLWFSLFGGAAIGVRLCWLAGLRAQSRAAVYAATQTVEPITFVALSAAVIVMMDTPPPQLIILAMGAATTLIAIFAIGAWQFEGGWRPDRSLVQPLVMFSGPLVFHGLASTVLGTYDQVLINQLIGSEAAGTYAYAYRFGMAMALVVTAFSSVWLPYFLRAVAAKRADVASVAQQAINLLMVVSVVLMLILPPAARALGGEVYRSATGLIPWVVYAYVWFACYTVAVGYALHEKRTGRIAAATLACSALSIALNVLLLPLVGVSAAAYVTVVTYAALFAVQAYVAKSMGHSTLSFGRLGAKVAFLGLVPFALSVVGEHNL